MKRLILGSALLLISFLAMDAGAATTYKILSADLKTDSSFGTFSVSTTTFGAIVGVAYVLEATNDANLKSRFSSDFWLNNPQTQLPTLPQLKAAIKSDAISKNARQKMDADLTRAAVDSQPFIPVFGEDPGL